jgi:hypothetical protein
LIAKPKQTTTLELSKCPIEGLFYNLEIVYWAATRVRASHESNGYAVGFLLPKAKKNVQKKLQVISHSFQIIIFF